MFEDDELVDDTDTGDVQPVSNVAEDDETDTRTGYLKLAQNVVQDEDDDDETTSKPVEEQLKPPAGMELYKPTVEDQPAVQPEQQQAAAQPEPDLKPPEGWQLYGSPQEAVDPAKPPEGWKLYGSEEEEKPRGILERVWEGVKGGFGSEPIGGKGADEFIAKNPTWLPFYGVAGLVETAMRAGMATAGGAAGWIAGMLERNPDAYFSSYGISPTQADQLQRELDHFFKVTPMEFEMGRRQQKPLEGAAQKYAPEAPVPEVPSEPVVQPDTTGVKNQDWTGPPADVQPAPPPAQGQLPLGQTYPGRAIDTDTPPTIGGGEAQLGLPLPTEPAPPSPRSPGIRNQDWTGPPADIPERPVSPTPGQRPVESPELPLEPPPTVNAEGQSGFNVTAPTPRPVLTQEEQYRQAMSSKNSMPDGPGTAKEASPPPTEPHTAVTEGQKAQAEGRPSETGVNVLQPGQVDPTLSVANKPIQLTQRESGAYGEEQRSQPPQPSEGPPRTTFERPGDPRTQTPNWQGPPAPIPRNQQMVPRVPEATQGVTEPTLSPGHTRLYQGENAPPREFTTDRATAEKSGPAKYVDVPEAQMKAQFQPGGGPGAYNAHKLWESPKYRDRLQPVEGVRTQPVEGRAEPPRAAEPAPPPAAGEPPPIPNVPTGKPQVAGPELETKIAQTAQPMRRGDVVRGRSGRPIKTGKLPIGTEENILEAGFAKATGPKGEPRAPYREAATRQGPPEKPGKVIATDSSGKETIFRGATVHEAAVKARSEGYKPHQISHTDGTPYRTPSPQAKVAPSAGEAPAGKPPAAAAGKPPADGKPSEAPETPVVGPRKTEPSTLVSEGKVGDKKALDAAKMADDQMHQLGSVPAGDAQNYMDRTKAAAKMHPDIKAKGGERLYEAIESGKVKQLPEALQKGLDHATKDLREESRQIRKELMERGKIEKEPDDPNYIHRIVKNYPSKISDPISEGALPGMNQPSAAKELAFRGAQAKDGSRLVLSGSGEQISVMQNRKEVGTFKRTWNADRPPQAGDKFSYNGKEYTIDRGITKEIEQHATHADNVTPVEYHKNALLSIYMENRQMRMMKAYHDWMDKVRGPESPFKEFMAKEGTPAGKEAEKRGWVTSKVPDLNGMLLHPDLAQAIHNNYNPGLGIKDINWIRAINQFAVRSIFWNPVPHSMNAFVHYLVARGWNLVPYTPARMKNFVKATFEGFEAAITQNKLLQDLNKSGASMIMSKIDSQNIPKNLGDLLKVDLKNNPGPWEAYARKFGIGKGIDAVNLIYNGSARMLWTFSDALMASAIREAELNGMTRKQAIDHTRIHMPDYRLPITTLGSRGLVRAMSDKNFSMFGRYHMGMLNSLSHMAMDGFKGTPKERLDALGNVMALVVLGFVVKPAVDGAVQKLTGNKDAETSPRGPLGPITNVVKAAQGKQEYSRAISNIFTQSPGIRLLMEGLSNKDWAGRKIIQPGSPPLVQAGQVAGHLAGTMASPYSTFGPTLQPGTSKGSLWHEMLQQLTDTKVPTAKQVAGKKAGEEITAREAKSREKKPRDLIEYGAGKADKAIRQMFR